QHDGPVARDGHRVRPDQWCGCPRRSGSATAAGPITLPAASSLPMTLQTAASRISETATAAIDPSAAIRDAYQRNHVALEHLRQAASQLKGSAHPAFNQLILTDEAALTELERTALA